MTEASIHHHDDSRDQLLAAFLDFAVDHFVGGFREVSAMDPETALRTIVDELGPPSLDDEIVRRRQSRVTP